MAEHKWVLVIAKGNDAPGDSLDSIYWCERCGTVRHDYAHGGGMKSPNYPHYLTPRLDYGAAINNCPGYAPGTAHQQKPVVTYAVEAWTTPGDEEPAELEMAASAEFANESAAKRWAWDRMGEGYAVRLWLR